MQLRDSAASREDLIAAYRLVLLRNPDEAGLRHFLSQSERGRLKLSDVVATFRSSSEYRSMTDANIATVDLGGYLVVVDKTEPDFGKKICLHRAWENHLVAVLNERLRPGDVFVDIGANVGVMAFAAAKRVGPNGKVIAFEPNESNAQMFLRGVAQMFLRGVAANGLESFVRLYPFALSDKPALFALQGSSNTHLKTPERFDRLVQSLPGDDILGAEPRIDFIKFDIEGHEPFALAGLKRSLAKHRPTVLCEFNPRCLEDHIGKAPEVFARELFGLTDEICAIEHSGRRSIVTDRARLMDLWRMRNREAVESRILPDGLLHFDLLFKADKLGLQDAQAREP